MGIFGRDDANPDQQPGRQAAGPAASPTLRDSGDQTVIARPSRIEGHVSGSGEIIVNGLVNGTIDAKGTVRVAEEGRVQATVHGKVVAIAGAVTGDITADERIELEASARVEGNLTAPRILIKDGATFRGQVNMREPVRRATVRTSSARKDTDVPSES
jgi:cytoskeletal protein CcmA (bactofilin family)